jgi:hypothetical protein
MSPIQAHSTINVFLFSGLLLFFLPSIHAMEMDCIKHEGQGKRQCKITQFFNKPVSEPTLNTQTVCHGIQAPALPKQSLKPEKTITLDLTKESRSIEEKPLYKPKENPKPSSQEQKNLKRSSIHIGALDSTSKRPRKIESEMQVSFLHGSDDHIEAYSTLIDEAESDIIIASWNVNFIPSDIFSSLLKAKRRGIHIGFIVNSVQREQTLDCFYDDEKDEDKETTFTLFTTKSHAKFLFVDSKSLILGSFNALGDAFEESEDASFMIQGTIQQLWPFYMSIYETYTSIEEYPGGIFEGIALISKARNPGERKLLQRSFDDGSQIFLLRTIKEHEDFFRLAVPHNGNVTIYSPFSAKDNTLKRLKKLETLLTGETTIHLKVLQQYESSLNRLLAKIPTLKGRTQVHVATSHQKIVILGDHTICAGSLNWLSAAQDAKDPYGNVELSVVLQGAQAEGIIKSHFAGSNGMA